MFKTSLTSLLLLVLMTLCAITSAAPLPNDEPFKFDIERRVDTPSESPPSYEESTKKDKFTMANVRQATKKVAAASAVAAGGSALVGGAVGEVATLGLTGGLAGTVVGGAAGLATGAVGAVATGATFVGGSVAAGAASAVRKTGRVIKHVTGSGKAKEDGKAKPAEKGPQ